MTANVRTMRCPQIDQIGQGLPRCLRARGEIYMRHADFEKLKARRRSKASRSFANPRNAAAGFVRQLDPSVTAQAAVALFRLWLGRGGGPACRDAMGLYEALSAWGFPLNPLIKLARGVEEMLETYRQIEERRSGPRLRYRRHRLQDRPASTSRQRLGFRHALARAAPSPINFPPRRRPPSCATSIFKWAAPAR